jgi:hypothetical protein
VSALFFSLYLKQKNIFNMAKKQKCPVSAGKTSDTEQLTQTIIDEMRAQGFLGDFTDKNTGATRLEIQFSDQTIVCNVNTNEAKKD